MFVGFYKQCTFSVESYTKIFKRCMFDFNANLKGCAKLQEM